MTQRRVNLAGFITKTAPEEPLMGETLATDDGGATVSLEPGTLQVLLPGEDVKFSTTHCGAARSECVWRSP